MCSVQWMNRDHSNKAARYHFWTFTYVRNLFHLIIFYSMQQKEFEEEGKKTNEIFFTKKSNMMNENM